MEIKDSLALDAFKMLVRIQVRIKTFGAARTFHNKNQAHIREGVQRSVDRVEADIGIIRSDLPEDHFHGRMIV